jgi:hypothetical protein
MSTLTVIIGITVPILTYLIGRYYKAVKQTNYDNLSKARDYWQGRYYDVLQDSKETKKQFEAQSKEVGRLLQYSHKLTNELQAAKEVIANAPKFQVVANKDKHPAANDNYLYIEGTINGQREAGLLRLKQWDDAKATLLKNTEDKPL